MLLTCTLSLFEPDVQCGCPYARWLSRLWRRPIVSPRVTTTSPHTLNASLMALSASSRVCSPPALIFEMTLTNSSKVRLPSPEGMAIVMKIRSQYWRVGIVVSCTSGIRAIYSKNIQQMKKAVAARPLRACVRRRSRDQLTWGQRPAGAGPAQPDNRFFFSKKDSFFNMYVYT